MPVSSLHPLTALRASMLALTISLAACSSGSSDAPAPATTATPAPASPVATTDDETIIDVPATDFLMGLIKTPGFNSGAEMGDGSTIRVNLPAIWVFSPDGTLTRSVTKSEKLATFAADFKLNETEGVVITCPQLEAALQGAVTGETKVDLACTGGKWVAVALSGRDSGQCPPCQEYADVLNAAAKQHSDELQATTVFMEM